MQIESCLGNPEINDGDDFDSEGDFLHDSQKIKSVGRFLHKHFALLLQVTFSLFVFTNRNFWVHIYQTSSSCLQNWYFQ